MKIEVLTDADAVARRAAEMIASAARAAVAARDVFTFAVSGGRTPWQMLRALSGLALPWNRLHIFQVDERVAPNGDPDRNLTHIDDSLLAHVPLPAANVHAMPVEIPQLDAAAAGYAEVLATVAGSPPVLDLVHLGLGLDGHTASLVPDDPVLEDSTATVAMTAPYQGRRRMTLTFPVLDRARCVLWVVTGVEKSTMLARLVRGDPTIPAGRVNGKNARILADVASADGLR